MKKICFIFIALVFCLVTLTILNCPVSTPIIDEEKEQTSSYSASSIANTEPLANDVKIIFLHHSTGGVSSWFTTYNTANTLNYQITQRAYPSGDPYPWDNYPYDSGISGSTIMAIHNICRKILLNY